MLQITCLIHFPLFIFRAARFAMLPYGLDSNVTKRLGNLLTMPSVFIIFPTLPCNLVSIKIIIIISSIIAVK